VVDENIDLPVRVERGLHNRLGRVFTGDTVGVGDRFTACVHDLLHDGVNVVRFAPEAVGSYAEVVNDELRAAGGEQHRVRSAEAGFPAGPGDNHDLVVESQLTHVSPLGSPSYRGDDSIGNKLTVGRVSTQAKDGPAMQRGVGTWGWT